MINKTEDQLKEFEEFIKKFRDCPEELYKSAKTKWQKLAAVEFFRFYKELEGIKKDVKWVKWLVIAIFGASVLGVLTQIFPKLFGL